MSVSDFARLGLRPELLNWLSQSHINHATPAQRLFIPAILQGHNLIGQAPTGSGKTLAYLLPLLQICLNQAIGRRLSAIVVVPTRELAQQIYWQVQAITGSFSLRTRYLMGGHSRKKQRALCHRGSNVLVTTPGRLSHFLKNKLLRCQHVKMVVFDEADALFHPEYQPTLDELEAALPDSAQSVSLSASAVSEKNAFILNPKRETRLIRISGVVPSLKQSFTPIDSCEKKAARLDDLLQSKELKQAIIFTDTKSKATHLQSYLSQRGYPAVSLHSDHAQVDRTRTLREMLKRRHRILVTTDLAARGIDIQSISHVINYDLPKTANDYRHRVGRTARNGRLGHAITLVTPEDEARLAEILKALDEESELIIDQLYPGDYN